MSIGDILDGYEDELRFQAEARRQGEEKLARRRAVAREEITACLKQVIEPILLDARNQLEARGYSSVVDYQQRVESSGEEKTTWAIGIYLETKGGKVTTAVTRIPKLLFLGDMEHHAIAAEHDYAMSGISPEKDRLVPVQSVNKAYVETHVRAFLSKAFQAPRMI